MSTTKRWDEKELSEYTPADLLAALQELYWQITGAPGEGWDKFARLIPTWMKSGLDVPTVLNAFVLWLSDESADHAPEKAYHLWDYTARAEKLRKVVQAARRKKKNLVPSRYCTGRIHIGGACFKVYDFATAISRKSDGECWLSWRTAAKWCGINKETAGLAVSWLVKNGWLVELVAPKFGREGKGHYRVVDHGAWVRAHDASGCVLVAPDRVDDDDPPED